MNAKRNDFQRCESLRRRGWRRDRRGFSLIESVVAGAVGAVISTIALALIVAALASYARSRDHFNDSLILDQLAVQFRADARAASDVALVGKTQPETAIDLLMAVQERVVYEIEPGDDWAAGCLVRRTRYRQDDVVGRESYTLRYFGAGKFAIDSPDEEKPAGDQTQKAVDASKPVADDDLKPPADGPMPAADGLKPPADRSRSIAPGRSVRLRLARQSASWVAGEGGAESARELSLQGMIGQDRRFESEEP